LQGLVAQLGRALDNKVKLLIKGSRVQRAFQKKTEKMENPAQPDFIYIRIALIVPSWPGLEVILALPNFVSTIVPLVMIFLRT